MAWEEPKLPYTMDEVNKAEYCIKDDYRHGKIGREQFEREMIIMARARWEKIKENEK